MSFMQSSQCIAAPTTRITMLGPSGVGKTCFMIGMYGIMREGVEGFTFSTPNPDHDLELSEAWDAMCDGMGPERWPTPNDHGAQHYEFQFNYALRPLMRFAWMDYRGGALRSAADEEDVVSLRQQLAGSSAVLLCVSGEWIARGVRGNARRKAYVADMNRFLTGWTGSDDGGGVALDPNSHVGRPPVAIVITKYDYCRDIGKDEMLRRVRELFHPLFAPGSGWLTTVCPVSLGMDLSENEEAGDVDPRNIHLPVTFAVYTRLRGELLRERAELDRERERLHGSRNAVSDMMGGRLKQWLYRSRIESAKDAVEFQRQQIAQLESLAVEMEQNINRLASELIREADVFFEGEEVEYDV